jgi:GWxTD domain-containing protein
LLAAASLALACAATGPAPPRTAADLTNPRLSPDWSQWLVGPIAWLATNDEVTAFLALADDAAAAAFADGFWARRDADPARPGNPARELFDRRAQDADRRFTEAGYRGRRTDRGILFVLHGEPAGIEFELSPEPGGAPLEVWSYAGDAPIGLDGRRPLLRYRFRKSGDLTVLYHLREVERVRGVAPPGR